MPQVSLTVVIPALDEEGSIRGVIVETLGALDDFGISGEVIVVDDGSTDGTGAIVRKLMAEEPRIRIVHHDIPHGVGAAFWDGVANATGEFLTWLPSDNEIPAGEVFRHLPLMKDVDLVVPFVFNKSIRSAFRNTVSTLFRLIVNLSFRMSFRYTNGTVLYRRSVLQELDYHCAGFFFTTDILARLTRRGYLFAEVPYRLRPRPQGHSRALSLRSLRKVTREYLRLFWSFHFSPVDKRPLVSDSMSAKRRQAA
jgi:glycosyltransferase involved in cell wall biosynthesis